MQRRHFLSSALSVAALSGAGQTLLSAKAKAANSTPPLPPRAIGVNYFDLFYGALFGRPHLDITAQLSRLKQAGIPFARFSCGPFWPTEWQKTFLADRTGYFKKLDDVIKGAEAAGFGLVPSLIWNPPAVSDLVGEPINAWGKPNSRTIGFMQDYVSTIVRRYSDSPAIWMWEFSNEFNTYADLPNALKWWPRVSVPQGTPATRTNDDLITAEAVRVALAAFSATVRQFDPKRLISSGGAIPRNNATNLAAGRWDQDSREQFRQALERVTPTDGGVVSIHLYPTDKGHYFGNPASGYKDILTEVKALSQKLAVPSFIGEFGVVQSSDKTADAVEFNSLLSDIVDSGVNYAALWVYDFTTQNGQWNVNFDNDRAYQLKLIADANKNMGLSAK